MHIDWGRVWDYLYGNRVAIGTGIMLALTAAIKTSPIPKQWGLLWLYDWLHQLLNITNTRLNTRLNTQPTITPPENAASPKA